jgi:hypothetical protein
VKEALAKTCKAQHRAGSSMNSLHRSQVDGGYVKVS